MSSEAENPRSKSELLERISRSYEALERLVQGVSDDQLTTLGGADDWSVKDHLAHIATWEKSLLALLQGRPRYDAMGVDQAAWEAHDTDALNAMIARRNTTRPLPDVLADFRHTHRQVLATLEQMTDDDLEKPYSHYQPDEPPHNPEPVISWIHGNTWAHMDEHQGSIRLLLDRSAGTTSR